MVQSKITLVWRALPLCMVLLALRICSPQSAEKTSNPASMDRCELQLHADPTSSTAQMCERDATVALALRQRTAGDGASSLATLERGHHAIPGDSILLLDLGIQAEAIGHLKRASEALHQALEMSPEDAKILYALARVETDQQLFPAAEQHLQQYLRLQADDATAHYGLGRVYMLQQETDRARTEFQRSIELMPIQTEAYYQLGTLALNAGDAAQATAMYGKVLERMPVHGGALTGMGMVHYRAKEYVAAQAYLAKAITAAPLYQPAHYYLGLTEERLGLRTESARELARALELAAAQQGKGQAVAVQ